MNETETKNSNPNVNSNLTPEPDRQNKFKQLLFKELDMSLSIAILVVIGMISIGLAFALPSRGRSQKVAPTITSNNNTTFYTGQAGSFTVTDSGTPTPSLSEKGTLPSGISFSSSNGVLSGTASQPGTYSLSFTASNTVSPKAVQDFTLTVAPSTAVAACTNSGATGAGTPTYTVNVGAPVANGGDSDPEIQTAINAASNHGSGEVVLQAGTYVIDETITVDSNVEIIGAGEGTTIIKAGTTNISIIDTNGNSNITLSGFTADASGNTLNDTNDTLAYTINIPNSTNVIVQNIATINPFSYSIVPDSTTKFCIRDDNVQASTSGKYTNLDGIHVEGSTKGDVLNNYVDTRYDGATDGDDGLVAQGYLSNQSDITFEGNIVRGGNNGDCMQFALGPDNITGDVVQDNEFWGCPFGIRTGGYANSGSITKVTINDNNVHNVVGGTGANGSFPTGGNAVDLGGFLESGQSASGNVVSNTYICKAGSVVAESGTTISNTVTYTGCKDDPTSMTPPPVMP